MSMILSGDGTVTGLAVGGLPNATIVQADLASGVAGNGPAFSAYKTGLQTGVSYGTWTKVQFPLENFDTSNCFDNTTASSTDVTSVVSSVVYCNGTTDYVEIYSYANGSGTYQINGGGGTLVRFSGCMVRAA